MTLKERFLTQLLPLLLGALSFWGGWQLMTTGFNDIQSLRQLERTPISSLISLIPGPAAVSGFAEIRNETLTSPYTKTTSLYFYYTREVETKDSDGNTSWSLAESKSDSVSFNLNDRTDIAEVSPSPDFSQINWSVKRKFQTVSGKERYTEWRIDPGDKLFIFSNVKQTLGADGKTSSQLTFTSQDGYSPLISSFDKEYEQLEMGSSGIYFLWGGLALVAMSLYGFSIVLRIHKVWQYQVILITVVSLVLIQFSLLLMNSDLNQATVRYQQQWQGTLVKLANSFSEPHETVEKYLTTPYTPQDKETLNDELTELKINLAMSEHLINDQLSRFPEIILAPLWQYSLNEKQRVSLTPEQQTLLNQRLSSITKTKLSSGFSTFFLILGLVIMAICTYFGFKTIKFKRLIENIPTQKTLGLVPGMAEVAGKVSLAENTTALESPLTSTPCCWYHYRVQEKRRSGDKDKWVTVINTKEHIDFLCEDDEGSVKIIPEDADVISSHTNSSSSGNRRYTETIVKIDDPLYVIGEAKSQPAQQDKLQITEAGSKLPFIVSNLPESKVMLRKAWTGLLFLNLAFTGIVISSLLWFAQTGSFSPSDFLLAALFGPIYMLLFSLLLHYNDLIFLKQRADRNWANISIAIRKKKNLIPALETIVKEYLQHETTVMTQTAEFRRAFENAQEEHASLEQCFVATQNTQQTMKAIIENYPDLKSHDIVSQFMTDITKLETELALLRNGYNDAVTTYNERLETFPDILFTKAFKFSSLSFFHHKN
ncbi:LemA family protein [Litoribacillus peritrichatus]|uniref:RING-type E3 ubiquitin transferase n=1 Tax=Litoribacillus peritrichatus TaxID=718191 RepID=A0ABP7M1Z4_9GAMM